MGNNNDPIAKLESEIKSHRITLEYHEAEVRDLTFLIEMKQAKLNQLKGVALTS